MTTLSNVLSRIEHLFNLTTELREQLAVLRIDVKRLQEDHDYLQRQAQWLLDQPKPGSPSRD